MPTVTVLVTSSCGRPSLPFGRVQAWAHQMVAQSFAVRGIMQSVLAPRSVARLAISQTRCYQIPQMPTQTYHASPLFMWPSSRGVQPHSALPPARDFGWPISICAIWSPFLRMLRFLCALPMILDALRILTRKLHACLQSQ